MRLIFMCLIIMTVNCNSQIEKNTKLENSLTDIKIEMRGNLIEINETEFRLDYYDIYEEDSHYSFLESKGYQGGGPSWLGIVYGAIKLSDPELLNIIRLDDEAEGLAIWSSNKLALEKIGRLISTVKSNEDILMQAIKIAVENGQME